MILFYLSILYILNCTKKYRLFDINHASEKQGRCYKDHRNPYVVYVENQKHRDSYEFHTPICLYPSLSILFTSTSMPPCNHSKKFKISQQVTQNNPV